jgi:mRNA-degrading endonuclease toxin of MazEF toxin-antitoxin module
MAITVNKTDLKEKIGQLSRSRIKEILEGLNVLFKPKDLYL